MSRLAQISILVGLVLLIARPLQAEDWPVYRHDNGRTGATGETLASKDLKPAWTYRSPQPPQPA